jgi:predicted secreted Zn-dependent protease
MGRYSDIESEIEESLETTITGDWCIVTGVIDGVTVSAKADSRSQAVEKLFARAHTQIDAVESLQSKRQFIRMQSERMAEMIDIGVSEVPEIY